MLRFTPVFMFVLTMTSYLSGQARMPGVPIAYSPPESGIYIGSPGIVRLDDGTYLAKHDEFGPKTGEHDSAITRVYRSADRGKSWEQLAKIDGLFWSSIFTHHGKLYMLGTQKHHGNLVVMRSDDGGATWTKPTDAKTGLIREGRFHTAPMALIEHDGRLWRSIEDGDGPAGWGQMYRPRVMSIPLDGDLLDAAQWTVSEPIQRDGGWLGGKFWCVLEGNLLLDQKTGLLRNVLRSNKPDLAAVATVEEGGAKLTIDPEFSEMPFPGGTDKKFLIRWDEQTQQYFALGNPIAPTDAGVTDTGGTRNTLALYKSPDLRSWTLCTVLLYHPDRQHYGFQYPDWIIEGDDMLVASRTAYDSRGGVPHRQHDANFLTFHRFTNFRNLTPADGIQLPQPPAAGEPQTFGALQVSGSGFEVVTLQDGGKAFGNRNYIWQNVPNRFRGAKMTRTDGGARAQIEVEATADTTLYVVTGGPTDGVDLSAFKPVEGGTFSYNDRGQTSMQVYARPLKAGERVTLPTGNWAGVNVLSPAN